MKAEFPYLVHIEPIDGLCIKTKFSNGTQMTISLGEKIISLPALSVLSDPKEFFTARVDKYGRNLEFSIGEVFGADNLYAWGIEQRGEVSHAMLWEWIYRNNLTQENVANALGISKRMLNYYLLCAKPIPKTVWLACLGWESQQTQKTDIHATKVSSPHNDESSPSRVAALYIYRLLPQDNPPCPSSVSR